MLGLPDRENYSETELDQMIENACTQANCWDFIQKLPEKLDTKVGDSGAAMSGGQKVQLIII